MHFAGLNLLAIVLAAIVSFMFGWLWYGVLFPKQWMAALGTTEEELKKKGPSPMPFAIAFIAQIVMAWVLCGLLRHLGPGAVTVKNGLVAGFFLWLGFVMTTLIVNHTFQGTSRTLTAIDGGHWLGVLLLQGIVVGLLGVSA
jgi:hypothetical protein